MNDAKRAVTQGKSVSEHGRMGMKQDGPELVREHQPGPSPTESSVIGRGASMVLKTRPGGR